MCFKSHNVLGVKHCLFVLAVSCWLLGHCLVSPASVTLTPGRKQCQTTKPETSLPADQHRKFFIPMFLFLNKKNSKEKKFQLWWKKALHVKRRSFPLKKRPHAASQSQGQVDNRWVSACGSLKRPKNNLLSLQIYKQALFFSHFVAHFVLPTK